MEKFKNSADIALNWNMKNKGTKIGACDFPMKAVKTFKSKVDFALDLGNITHNPFPEKKKK